MDWAKFIDALEPQECILLGQTLSLKVNPTQAGTYLHGITMAEERLIKAGKVIQAIKAVRDRTGMGLREAKKVCDDARSRFAAIKAVPVPEGADSSKLAVRIAAAIAEEYFEVPSLGEVSSLVDIIERVLTH